MALLAAGLTKLVDDVLDYLPAEFFDFDQKATVSYELLFHGHSFTFVKYVTTEAHRPPPRYINYKVQASCDPHPFDVFVYSPRDPQTNLSAAKRALAQLASSNFNGTRSDFEYA